jgi:hypothetical protein
MQINGKQIVPLSLTLDEIAPAFAISSFSGGSTVEIGATVTNPAFTASYSSLPTSAQITNTDGLGSPLILTTPFASGTVLAAFTHGTQTSVTFTLTAIAATTKTSNQSINFYPRVFGGVGTAGATGATASGTTAVLSGAVGTLANEGLTSSSVGASYGPFSPTSQKIYLLLTGSSHTFKDQGGFSFAMNAPTSISFVNQNGATVSMYLYESTNLLSTPFTVTVVT